MPLSKKIQAAILFLCCIGSFSWGSETIEELRQENRELRMRVDRLESDLAELKNIIRETPAEKVEPEAKPPVSQAPARPSVTSRFQASIYGHVRADGAYDSHRTNSGNTAQWVTSEKDGRDSEYNLTARHSRLGLNLKAPDSYSFSPSARGELDFYGAGQDDAPGVRLRHAYFRLDHETDWFLLAGLTNDVHAPLNMRTLNTAIGWNHGNLGFRRPQVRIGKDFRLGADSSLLAEFAVARPLAVQDYDKDGHDDGEDSGIPDFQGRMGLTLPIGLKEPITVGIGGHYGRRELDLPAGEIHARSWSAVVDFQIRFTAWLMLQGEAFTGECLDGYRGGIGQGIIPGTDDEIRSRGGFADLLFQPHKRWKGTVGMGIDDPVNSGMSSGMRERNRTAFANIAHDLTETASVGLEYQRIETDYKNMKDGTNHRIQSSFVFRF